MIHADDRISKDIDAFIDDPQYLSILSPRLTGESVWACDAFAETAHYLKLVFPEGEVDFIAAAAITDLQNEQRILDVGKGETGASRTITIEHPVETALKKLHYRGSLLKVRDIFDIDVVATLFPQLLREKLHHIAHLKSEILARLAGLSEQFLRSELEELAISEQWREQSRTCLERVRQIAQAIP